MEILTFRITVTHDPDGVEFLTLNELIIIIINDLIRLMHLKLSFYGSKLVKQQAYHTVQSNILLSFSFLIVK